MLQTILWLQSTINYNSNLIILISAIEHQMTLMMKKNRKFVRKSGYREGESVTTSSVDFTYILCPNKWQIDKALNQFLHSSFNSGKRLDDKMDLKDAYFPLPIKQEDRKRDKKTYKFTCFFLDATRMFTRTSVLYPQQFMKFLGFWIRWQWLFWQRNWTRFVLRQGAW